MQAFFDRYDAELEYETLVSRSRAKADPSADSNSTTRSATRRAVDIIGLSVLLFVAAIVFADHIATANPEFQVQKPEPKVETVSFIIEIPPPPKVELKPLPKPPEPEPEPVERLRSVPDRQIEHRRKTVDTKERDTQKRQYDRNTDNQVAQRAMPAVSTPVIEESIEILERVASDDRIGYAVLDAHYDTIGAFTQSAGPNENRYVPDEDLSRIKLDTYHYQMVNVCMRLCLKSMFTLSGLSEQRADASSSWLRVNRSDNASLEYLAAGRWVKFKVFVKEITNISRINFVELPLDGRSDSEINDLLEN
ncbi:MAG: hypothetical protein KAT85_06630, partial [candidate division Zixibacteria bacterium]|nr:hypothetical protein [candidate division Zixibacteria bacterium]